MGEAAYRLQQKPEHNVEIVVHVDEALEEERREDVVTRLGQTEGIKSADFCPLRFHLMVISYDRDVIGSQDVLASIKSQDIHAQLIGPV